MRTSASHQSRADLENLLDGRPVRPDAVADLLAAARASGAPADTAGLPAALAAFRSVSSPFTADHPRRTSMLKNVAAKIVAAKLLTVGGVALAAATGGIAAAASTGHLPSPLPHSSHASDVAVDAVAASHGTPSAGVNPASATDSASATESDSDSSEPTGAHPSATPSPSLRGLCQSWLARPHEHGKADTNPAFTVLVTTAGDTDAVAGYCTTLLSTAPGEPEPSSTSPSPSDSASPSTSHQAGRPSTVPAPSHSTGKPTPLPTPSHPGR